MRWRWLVLVTDATYAINALASDISTLIDLAVPNCGGTYTDQFLVTVFSTLSLLIPDSYLYLLSILYVSKCYFYPNQQAAA
jgi:hypothetical protein